MSTYKFSYCPHCKKNLDFMTRSEIYFFDRYIGLQYQRCPHCKKIYKTTQKFYYQMSDDEKKDLHLAYIGNIFFTGLTYTALILILLFISISFLSNNLDDILNNEIGWIFLISAIPGFGLGYYFSKKNYEEIKLLNVNNYKDIQNDNELIEINSK